jgi:hypothetical protein
MAGMGRKQTLAGGAGGFPNFAVSPWKTVIFFKALVLGPTFSPTLCVGLNEMQWAALGQEVCLWPLPDCLLVAAFDPLRTLAEQSQWRVKTPVRAHRCGKR